MEAKVPSGNEIIFNYAQVRVLILDAIRDNRLDFLNQSFQNFKNSLKELKGGSLHQALLQEGFQKFLKDLPPYFRA